MPIYVFYKDILFLIASCMISSVMLFRFPFVVIIAHIFRIVFSCFSCVLCPIIFSLIRLSVDIYFPLCSLAFYSGVPRIILSHNIIIIWNS
jgi:hypothetical protein